MATAASGFLSALSALVRAGVDFVLVVGYDLVTAAWWAGRACEPPGTSPVRREAAFTPRIVWRLFPGGLHPAWRLLDIVYRP